MLLKFSKFNSLSFPSKISNRLFALKKVHHDNDYPTVSSNNPHILPISSSVASLNLSCTPTSSHASPKYHVYKRRFVGLFQLSFLNILGGMGWLTYASISTTSSNYYNVPESKINWFSTSFLLSFAAALPLTLSSLNRSLRFCIILSTLLIFSGYWLRFFATLSARGKFPITILGQILISAGQALTLSAPTRYSRLWFTEKARVTTIAVVSLTNPLGSALAEIVCPLLASQPSDVPRLILYLACFSTLALPSLLFVKARPPAPVSATSDLVEPCVSKSWHIIRKKIGFWLLLIPFVTYVGLFNAVSTLLNQILAPYGFSETEAGICGGVMILSGLVFSAIVLPILDRTRSYIPPLKFMTCILACSFITFTFAPITRKLGLVIANLILMGASAFPLIPLVLETIAQVGRPACSELGSAIGWAFGQVIGVIFSVIMELLKDTKSKSNYFISTSGNYPPGNMTKSLIFQAAFAILVLPCILVFGINIFRRNNSSSYHP